MNRLPFFNRIAQQGSDYEQNSWGIIDILTTTLFFFIILYAKELKSPPKVDPAPSAAMSQASAPAPAVKSSPEPSQAEMQNIREYFAGYLGNGFYIAENNKALSLVLEEQLSFDTGAAKLNDSSAAILNRIAELLQKEAEYGVTIAGHSDDLPIRNGAFASNWHLSTARSISVAEYFIGKGIAPERITTQGFAEFRPLLPNSSEENRKRNRRVEITLIKKESSRE